MNSKERVRMAVEHKQPDYVPSSLECVETAWDKLKKHFGTEKKENVWNSLRIDLRSMYMPLRFIKTKRETFKIFIFLKPFPLLIYLIDVRNKKHPDDK